MTLCDFAVVVVVDNQIQCLDAVLAVAVFVHFVIDIAENTKRLVVAVLHMDFAEWLVVVVLHMDCAEGLVVVVLHTDVVEQFSLLVHCMDVAEALAVNSDHRIVQALIVRKAYSDLAVHKILKMECSDLVAHKILVHVVDHNAVADHLDVHVDKAVCEMMAFASVVLPAVVENYFVAKEVADFDVVLLEILRESLHEILYLENLHHAHALDVYLALILLVLQFAHQLIYHQDHDVPHSLVAQGYLHVFQVQ